MILLCLSTINAKDELLKTDFKGLFYNFLRKLYYYLIYIEKPLIQMNHNKTIAEMAMFTHGNKSNSYIWSKFIKSNKI